jgi:hypothetical protein
MLGIMAEDGYQGLVVSRVCFRNSLEDGEKGKKEMNKANQKINVGQKILFESTRRRQRTRIHLRLFQTTVLFNLVRINPSPVY